MLSKEKIEKILETNIDIITYKADKDFRCLTSTEKALLENNNKIAEYVKQLETNNKKLIEKLEEDINECIKNIEEDERHDEWGYEQCKIQILNKILKIVKGENNGTEK